MKYADLFEAIMRPAHGYAHGPGGIDYAIESLDDGKRWLILQGTIDKDDVERDARFFGARIYHHGEPWIFHRGMAEAAEWLYIRLLGQFDAITGHSLGAGEAEILSILSDRPAVTFGGPRIIYQAPEYARSLTVNVVTRGDPIAHVVPGFRYRSKVIRAGVPRLWPRVQYHLPDYYRAVLKGPAGRMEG